MAAVEAVREAVGDSMEIMVDANQAWPIHGFSDYPTWDLKRAMRTARMLEELDTCGSRNRSACTITTLCPR